LAFFKNLLAKLFFLVQSSTKKTKKETSNAPLHLELSSKFKILIQSYNSFFHISYACDFSLMEEKLGTKLKRALFWIKNEFDL